MHIKTYILTLLLLCLGMPALAQGDALFDEFKRERNAEYIKIPAIVTAMGKLFMGNESEEQFAKKVRTVRVLDMEKCSAGVKRRFDRLCALQNEISEEIHHSYVGKTLRCLVDGKDKSFLTARTEGGRLVRFCADESLIGTYQMISITGATTWSLSGELSKV